MLLACVAMWGTAIRFYALALAFHALVLALAVHVVREHRERPQPGGRGVLRLLGHALAGFAAMAVLALLLALATPRPVFPALRLLAQGVFGEAVLVGVVLAWMEARRRSPWPAAAAATGVAALLTVYTLAYHVGPRQLNVESHAVDATRGPARGRLRILHLSDLQSPRFGDREREAMRRGLAERPDLVVLTGDYVHERLATSYDAAAEDLRAILAGLPLTAPLGAYAVPGDVERPAWRDLFRGTPVVPLADEVHRLDLPGGRSLEIVALGARRSRARDARAVAELLPPARPMLRPAALGDGAPALPPLRIVMGHAPDFVDVLPGRVAVDLALAGHTHGGQVVLPFLGPPLTLSRLPRRFAGGLADYEGIPLHVSRGLGMERGAAPQIRFNCPPEVCLIDVSY